MLPARITYGIISSGTPKYNKHNLHVFFPLYFNIIITYCFMIALGEKRVELALVLNCCHHELMK